MSAIFVAGTGTDIGKTWITAALLRCLRAQGIAATAIKPVVSGFDPRNAASSDPGVLLTAMGMPFSEETIASISPFRFAAPLAPNMAARLEGKALRLDAIVDFCRERIAQTSAPLLIEGVGGIMSPVAEGATGLDLMDALKCPALLVAGSYLGTISHTLTALKAAAHINARVRAIVVNETPGAPVELEQTCAELRHFARGIPVIPLRRDGTQHDDAFAAIILAGGLLSAP